jgi:hypothetical protein
VSTTAERDERHLSVPPSLLIEDGLARLRKVLPEGFEVTVEESPGLGDAVDGVWGVQDTSSHISTQILVQAEWRLTPKSAATVFGGQASLLRHLSPGTAILVVSPWLGRPTRAALEREGINYLDQTGNVHLRIRRPAVFIHLQGSDRDPSPPARSPARLTGARANRVVRALVEVRPPYRAADLARATDLSPGYLSRALDSLDELALIRRRGGRGMIEDVDWPELIRTRASTYKLLRSNVSVTYTSPQGWATALNSLPDELVRSGRVAVTGSVAANAVNPVAAPGQLVLYVGDETTRDLVRKTCRLLPAQRGGDVVLLIPADASQLWGVRGISSLPAPTVAISQLAIDCLAGNGRLPEEGEAILGFMRENEDRWRLSSLVELREQRL